MAWQEISFEIPKSQADFYCEQLETLGAVSVSFFDASNKPILEPLPGTTPLWEKLKIVGLFSKCDLSASIIDTLQNLLPNISISVCALAEQDWTRTWLEHFKPLQFGKNLWIIPTHFEAPLDKNAIIIKLDPGLAFGTGTHPTTALCLQWLDKHPPYQQQVLDYGCGSGILGIAALKLGANKVWAIDYDPQALLATQANCQRNDISIEALSCCLPEQLPSTLQANCVLANILAEPLIALASTLAKTCIPGGKLVLSGLLKNQIDAVCAAYDPWFCIEATPTEQEWALISAVRR
ncbi:MAG: 50S ribosomal protein L11 methyltransferase [Proteobacteria bacterium]|nr:50S ribosomal protein L11 methyltransferase [Pseudomonadota bacterium]